MSLSHLPAAVKRLLHQLYGGIHGYWTCPAPSSDGRIDCLTEVHAGRRRHQISARQSALTTCRNALGDAMRYRPAG